MCLGKFMENRPFTRMIVHSLIGALCGIVSGFLLAMLIAFIANKVGIYIDPREFSYSTASNMMPYNMVAFMGMGFGAIVGAILGGVSANKK